LFNADQIRADGSQCFGNALGGILDRIQCVPGKDGQQHIREICLTGKPYKGSLQNLPPLNLTYLERFDVIETSLTGGLPKGLRGPVLYRVTFSGNPHMSGGLPQEWASPLPPLGAAEKQRGVLKSDFPLEKLVELTLEGSAWSGSLPVAWAADPRAFQSLQYLRIIGIKDAAPDGSQPPGLTGSIPPEWVSGKAFPKLQVLPQAAKQP
jgi:hypothetical protein